MKTNLRVDRVLNYIPSKSKVADIGCDHGYVLIKGVLKDIINLGVGVEVAKGPFQQAKVNVTEYNLQDKIDIRFGNGLEPLIVDECDICVIGGMGGRLIKKILSENIEKSRSFKRLILQPMNSEMLLRQYLLENNWKIIDEDILIDERIYLYIIVEKGNMVLEDDFLFEIGPILAQKNTDGKEQYISEKILKLDRVKENIKKIKVKENSKLEKIEISIEKWRNYLENK